MNQTRQNEEYLISSAQNKRASFLSQRLCKSEDLNESRLAELRPEDRVTAGQGEGPTEVRGTTFPAPRLFLQQGSDLPGKVIDTVISP